MADKSTFELIWEATKNFTGSMAKAAGETTVAGLTAIPNAVNEAASLIPQISQEGFWNTLHDRVYKRPINTISTIAGNTYDFYTKPGVIDRIVADPARPLMDAASVAGLVGAGAKAAGMPKVAKGSFWIANKVDPFTLSLDIAKSGLRAMGAPRGLYKGVFEKLSGTGGKLDDSAIQELTATANESGYVRSQSGKENIAAANANLSKNRKTATDTLTQDIPITDMQGMLKRGMDKFGDDFGAGTALSPEIRRATTKAEDFLHGTEPGDKSPMPGRRSTNQPINPGDPDTRMYRAISGKDLHQKVLKVDNERTRPFFENAQHVDPNNTKMDMEAVVALNREQRKYIGGLLGPNGVEVPKGVNIGQYTPVKNPKPGMPQTELTYPKKAPSTTGFEESGQQGARLINLRKADNALKSGSSVMGAHQTATEAAGLVNPNAYTATYSIIDKFWKNPTARTKLAASINKKSQGSISQALRGARRTLFQLGEHEQPEQESTKLPDRPYPE